MTKTANSEIAELFLSYSDNKLEQLTKTMTTCLEQLSEEQIWARGGAHENAAGNLVLHLCGNMRQWIMHGVGGAEDVRMRDEEFATTGGIKRADLIARFSAMVDEARRVIRSVPHERLPEVIYPQGRESSVLAAIYQVVGHVQEHTGQVVLLTKQLTGRDLDLTIPRKR